MEGDKLITYSRVRQRVRSCLQTKNGSHSYVRGILIGSLLPVIMGQFIVYTELSLSVDLGDLPWFMIDAVIVSVALVEVFLAPLISWIGDQKRRTVMMAALAVSMVALLLILVVPADRTQGGTELCHGVSVAVGVGISARAAVRLSLLLVAGVATSLSNVAIWCHGIAYMEEHKMDGMSQHLGIVVAARVLATIMVPKLLHPDMKIWVMLLSVVVPMLIPMVQLLRVPEIPPQTEETLEPTQGNRRRSGFGASLSRVIFNSSAVYQMLAIALMVAAFWGFGYHERDIVKVLYNIDYSNNWMSMYADMLRYHFVILAVVYCGVQFSKPLMPEYNSLSAMKLGMILTVLMVPLFIVMVTVFSCTRGNVAGREGHVYTRPSCSNSCTCSPGWNVFNPVCVVETLTTYLSPCHAGCVKVDNFDGISAYSNCTCAGDGRATAGACNSFSCVIPFELHKLVYLTGIIFFLTTLQAQVVVVLRMVSPRDRSLALGVCCSIVALVTFVLAHLGYFAIRTVTCAWFEGGKCQLHGTLFPYLVGGLSALLVLASAVISVSIFCGMQQPTIIDSRSNPNNDI